MSSRVLSVANQITLLRLVFVPVFALLMVDGRYRAALAIIVAAAVSDVADGLVARLFHQRTELGVALDPIADKILMTTAYLVLSFTHALPWWLTMVVVTRDVGILMTAAVISLVNGYRPFHPTVLGKFSTAAQVAAALAAVCWRARVLGMSGRWVEGFAYLAAALTAASGIHYLIIARHRFGQPAELIVAQPPSRKAKAG